MVCTRCKTRPCTIPRTCAKHTFVCVPNCQPKKLAGFNLSLSIASRRLLYLSLSVYDSCEYTRTLLFEERRLENKRSIMMRPNMRQGPAASVGVPAPEKASAAMGVDCKTGDGATEEQARAIICTAKRALEEEAKRGEADGGRLSIKKSLEWFLERRRKTTAAGVHRRHHEASSSSSSD